jgi:ankyrin repeat protein
MASSTKSLNAYVQSVNSIDLVNLKHKFRTEYFYNMDVLLKNDDMEPRLDNIWLVIKSVLDGRLDILENAIYSGLIEEPMLKIIALIACKHSILDAISYLDAFVTFDVSCFYWCLHRQSCTENDNIVRILIENKVNCKLSIHHEARIAGISIRDLVKDNDDVASWFIAYGNIELMQEFVLTQKKKPNLNLFDAISTKNLKMVISVIELGANTNIKGHNIMLHCAKYGTVEIALYLVQNYGFEFQPNKEIVILAAISTNNLDFVRYLAGLNWDVAIPRNNRALSTAVNNSNAVEMCKFLVIQGASMKSDAKFAFAEACIRGHLEIAKYLLELNPTLEQISAVLNRPALRYNRRYAPIINLPDLTDEIFNLFHEALLSAICKCRKINFEIKKIITPFVTTHNWQDVAEALRQR